MFDQAIAALDGIERFVNAGQTVVVKPNIGWDRAGNRREHEPAAGQARIVEQCVNAGAETGVCLRPRDQQLHSGQNLRHQHRRSGQSAGGAGRRAERCQILSRRDDSGRGQINGRESASLDCRADVLINVPVLKHHFASRLTIAMKKFDGRGVGIGKHITAKALSMHRGFLPAASRI